MSEDRVVLVQPGNSWGDTPINSTLAPKDTYRKVWLVCLLFGVGGLLPWNVFITCYDFFFHNYPSYPFEFLLSVFYNYACLPVLFVMIKFGPRLEFVTKFAVTSTATMFLLLAVPIFVMLISKTWTLWVVLSCVFVCGITSSIFISAAIGLGSQLPAEYIAAVMSGQGIAGIIAGTVRIVTKRALPNTVSGMNIATLIYFGLAAFSMYLCVVGYFVMRNSPFARHYVRWSNDKVEMQKSALYNSVSYVKILKRIWPEALNVFLAFFITLTLFPGTILLIPSRNGIDPAWFGIFLIFTFQVFDFIGRTAPRWVTVPGPNYLWIPSVARFAFFAAFILAQQGHVFTNDYWTFILDALMAITNGYFGTLSMMYAPSRVEEHERETAGNIMAFMLNVGIFAGVHAALILLKILTGSFGILPEHITPPTPSPLG